MSDPSTPTATPLEDAPALRLRRELERRLRLLEEADEAEFGTFTRLDWIVCTVAFFVLPLLAVWWWA
jgi:hypothetical protein